MRIGVDWGGTKIEVIALDNFGQVKYRQRIKTPIQDYDACVQAVCDLVLVAENDIGESGSVGIGIPGTISQSTGLVKNANSTWLNGKPLLADMTAALARPIKMQNDANCFAVSEATDGAGAGKSVVIGVILGTGCGCGIAINGKALSGLNGITGEFGHTPLPYITAREFPGRACWCGKRGCLETYISGTGFERTYEELVGFPSALDVQAILQLDGDDARTTYNIYMSQLTRGLSTLINVIDPDVIVLGGGMSNVEQLYDDVPKQLAHYIFSDSYETPIVKAKHGDSSGVRGAAWLWGKN